MVFRADFAPNSKNSQNRKMPEAAQNGKRGWMKSDMLLAMESGAGCSNIRKTDSFSANPGCPMVHGTAEYLQAENTPAPNEPEL